METLDPETFQLNKLNVLVSNKQINYLSIQLHFLFYTFTFWIGLFVILSHKYELIRIEKILLEIAYTYIINTKHVQQLNRIKEKLFFTRFNIKRLNDSVKSHLRVMHAIYSYMNKVNTSIKKSNKAEDSPRSINLGLFLYHNFKQFIYLAFQLKQSLGSIIRIFSFDIKAILLYPLQLKSAIGSVICQFKSFWRQIEQIIQIIRLPIELLSMIGRFFKGIRDFSKKIERPHIRSTF